MKSTELRIGNLIFNDSEQIQNVYGVDEKSILTKIDINGWSICFKPKPIPLTEETILKVENLRESIFYNGEKLKGFYIGEECLFCVVLIDGRVYYYEQTDSENWGYVGACIDYIHELQNMYYWFNNQKKELTIK